MGRCLGTTPSFVSAMVRDSTAQGVMPESPKAWKEHSLVITCSNGVSEEFIGIHAKSRCQWSGCSIHLEPGPQRYGQLKP